MTAAPASFANCSAKMDTPPVPCTSTVSPGRMWASSKRARHAVSAAHGSVAASSNVRLEGMRLTPSASRTISSCSTPGRVPPRARRRLLADGLPSNHDWKNIGHTRSPTETRVTPSPTAAISPAPSENGMNGRLYDPPFPSTVRRSRKFREAARIRTTIWPGPGLGSGRSTKSIASMDHSRETCHTFTSVPRVYDSCNHIAVDRIAHLPPVDGDSERSVRAFRVLCCC